MTGTDDWNACILAVDDVEENLDIVVDALSDQYDVRVATDGPMALEIIEQEVPDLILLDIMMPGMDGLEVCRRLKADQDSAGIPVIFLTAKTESADIVRGFELGGADYVTKPFQIPELLARVRAHLEIKFARDQIERANAEQREMLHVLCHDLANPFNSILSVIDAFGHDPEALADYLPLMEKSARNGTDLIELIRTMRAAEEKPVALSPVCLSDAVQDSVAILSQRLDDKKQLVDVAVDAGITVIAEPASLVNSVIANALTNASKFSPDGAAIEISAESLRSDGTGDNQSNDTVILSIADSGVGMPSDLVADLFDISKATSRPGTSGELGTGFGMPLMARFMKIYGGSISVESRERVEGVPDYGTTVFLQFRAHRDTESR